MRAEWMVGKARVGRIGQERRCEGRHGSGAEGMRGKGRKGESLGEGRYGRGGEEVRE